MWKTKVKQWSGLIITVCITLAVFLGMKFSMPFVYSVNDDRFARDILSGAYTGTPDGHIEHMRYLICLPLCILFRIFPGVDWYAVMLFVIHGLCFFLVLYQLAKGIKTWYGKLLVWLIFVEIFIAAWSTEVVFFTYTTASAVLAATAIFWYLTTEENWKNWIICVLLAVISYAVRNHNFIMAVPAAGAAFIFKQVLLKRKISLKTFYFPLLLLAGLLLTVGINKIAYRGPVWENYLEYDPYRIDLYDYYKFPDYNQYKEIYDELGLTETDYHTLVRYGLSLSDKYTTEMFEKLSEAAKAVRGEESSFIQKIKDGLKETFAQLFSDRYKPLSYFAAGSWLAAFLYLLIKRKKLPWLMYGLFLAGQGLVWFYAGYRRRFPTRVGMSLYILMLLSGVAFLYCMWKQDEHSWVERHKKMLLGMGTAAFFALIPLAVIGWNANEVNAARNSAYNEDYERIEEYCLEHADNFYFVDVDSISRFTGIVEFTRENQYMNFMSLGDWTCFMSPYYEKLNREGISDVKDAILNKEGVFVIAKDAFNLDYLSDSYPDNVIYDIVDVIPCNGYEMYVYQYGYMSENETFLDSTYIRSFQSNVNQELTENTVDENHLTRWNGKQKEGLSFSFELDDVYEISGIRMTLGEWSTDYPRDITIETSVDGVNWTKQELSGDQRINFRFEPVSCQYVRMTLGENAGVEGLDLDWSIEQLRIYMGK